MPGGNVRIVFSAGVNMLQVDRNRAKGRLGLVVLWCTSALLFINRIQLFRNIYYKPLRGHFFPEITNESYKYVQRCTKVSLAGGACRNRRGRRGALPGVGAVAMASSP